jgi:hypothetical protein
VNHPKPSWDRFPLLSRAGRFARKTLLEALGRDMRRDRTWAG